MLIGQSIYYDLSTDVLVYVEASFYHRGIDHILICDHGGGDGKLPSRPDGVVYCTKRRELKKK